MDALKTNAEQAAGMEPAAGDYAGGRRRTAGNLHGAAPSVDARRIPHGRGAGRRAGGEAEAGIRLSAPQSRAAGGGPVVPGVDAVHGPAGLYLLADQQLGLRAGGGEAGGTGGAGARRVPSRDPGGADAGAEPCIVDRLPDPGDGRERHAADVRVQGAGKDSGPV